MPATDIVTLTGYLGKNPIFRDTKVRTKMRYRKNSTLRFVYAGHSYEDVRADPAPCEEACPVLDGEGETIGWNYEVQYPSRRYALLSLAVHQRPGSAPTWHQIVDWQVDHPSHFSVRRLCGRGDRVEIQGRKSIYTTNDGRSLERIELIDLKILERAPRNVPEYP